MTEILFPINNEPSKQKNSNQQLLARQIYFDQLTGLNNRFFYSSQLADFIDKAKKDHAQLAVVTLDLDRFGAINQDLGYEAGNYILQQIAYRLKNLINNENVLARIGSNKFAFLLKNYSLDEDLVLMLSKIMDIVNQPILIRNSPGYISASIGISHYPEHGDNPNLLISYSNQALLVSKKRGGNTWQFYNNSMTKYDKKQPVSVKALLQAIKKDQFVLYYQPIISAETSKIIGMEALIRWKHPYKWLLTPESFLGLCESTGLIVSLTRWVLHQACLQLKKFHEMGFPELFVAVNLSSRQFYDPQLFDTIKETLELTRVPPECLEIELSEHLSMHDIDTNASILNKLHDLGIQLAIDDFGTGYSSMRYLKRLPFNILKIDKSFIQDISIMNNRFSLVQAIIALGKNLGLTLIAVGVETEEQLSLLREMNCDLIQGYLFGKPIPEYELKKLLDENKASI